MVRGRRQIATTKARTESTVVTLGWTAREDLVVVYRNGRVDMYVSRQHARFVVPCCALTRVVALASTCEASDGMSRSACSPT